MAKRGWSILAVGAVSLVVFAKCSLITGNYNECAKDSECAAGHVCAGASPDAGERYCVLETIPAGCKGMEDAGILAMYGPADAGNAIHIGAAYNFTTNGFGPVSASRVQHLDSVVLALEEINQRGVGNGRPFVLHVCDSQGNTDLVKQQVSWMGDTLHIPAVLVTSSQPVLAAATATVPRGMLLVSPTATASEFSAYAATTDGGTRMMWRTAPSDVIQAQAISELLLGTSTYDAGLSTKQTVGLLFVADAYGQGLDSSILTALNGKKTLQSVSFTSGTAELLNGPVRQLDATSPSPELTVLMGPGMDAANIVNDAEQTTHLKASAGHRWFFTDAAKGTDLLKGTDAGVLEGDYGTAAGVGVGPAYTLFVNGFKSRFGMDPSASSFTANNYDAMYAIALGTAYAVGTKGDGALTGERIAQGLGKLSSGTLTPVGPSSFTGAASTVAGGTSVNLQGTSGNLDFNPATGEVVAPIELWQIKGGVITTAATLQPQ